MIVFANLLIGIAFILSAILRFMFFMIIGRVIISWVNADPFNPIVRAVISLTEPPLKLIRRYIPTTFGGLDLAPLILLLAMEFLQILLVNSLDTYGRYFLRMA